MRKVLTCAAALIVMAGVAWSAEPAPPPSFAKKPAVARAADGRTRIEFEADTSFLVRGPAIVLVTSGEVELDGLGRLRQGQSAFVPAADGPLALLAEPRTLAWVAGPGCVAGGIT